MRPAPHEPSSTSRAACALLARTVLVAVALLATGCLTRIDRSRDIVNHVRFHGVHEISEAEIQERIGTRPTDRFLGVVLPWTPREYYDDTTFRRDLERVERYYQARGYYSAAIQSVHLERDASSRQTDIDISLREGPPTRVGAVWLSGCETESRRADDPYPVSPETCARIRERLHLGYNVQFTEADFDADRQIIIDLLKDEGHAVAAVHGSATVDPVLRRANVVYVLDPGPTATFGDINVFDGSAEQPVREGRMPHSGYPVANIRNAVNIRRGEAFTRTHLSEAQRRLFELGAFGIVRIVDRPHRCDSQNRCDAAHDPSDRNQHVVVDVDVRLTTGRRDRLRFGGGFEVDQLRSDVHLGLSYEHRFVPLPGGMGRFRMEERPLVFLPFCFSSECSYRTLSLGNSLSFELREPQVWRSGTLVLNGSWDVGPDPINPGITDRSAARLGFGAQHEFIRHVVGGLYLRTNWLQYNLPIIKPDSERAVQAFRIGLDPIVSGQYTSQAYSFLEQTLIVDQRDNPLHAHSGFFLSLLGQESLAIPFVASYSFLRGSVDLRGYIPLGEHVTFAVRGFVGAAIGASSVGGWPVPQELRFYSGGATSNRGYPFSRVGYVETVPQCGNAGDPLPSTTEAVANCVRNTEVPQQDINGHPTPSTAETVHANANQPGYPDARRYFSVGGVTAWEFSAELRGYWGNFGAVLFFDASDVGGWTPPAQVPMRPVTNDPNALPTPPNAPGPAFAFGLDPHPSAGIGLRYLTPIGVARVDFGLRLDDLGCSRYNEEVASELRTTDGRPWYYVTSRPRCDVFGLQIPLAIQFAIGEVF